MFFPLLDKASILDSSSKIMNRCFPMLNGKLYLGGPKVGVPQGYVRWYLELIQNISPCSGDKALDLSCMDST